MNEFLSGALVATNAINCLLGSRWASPLRARSECDIPYVFNFIVVAFIVDVL